MKILIYGINYAPELTGIGKYTGEMAAFFADEGHQVEVITAPPYYPNWEVKKEYRGGWRKETLEGVTVLRCPLYVPKAVTGAKRILHEISFVISSLRYWFPRYFRTYDVIICVSPPFHLGFMALPHKWLRGTKVVNHIQDLQVDAARDLKIIRHEGLLSVLEKTERWLLGKMSRVSTISKGMLKKITFKGIPIEKTIMFPNWVDNEVVFPVSKNDSVKAEWGFKESDQIVLYSGNLGEKQGLSSILNVADQFRKRDNLHFIIIGNGGAKERLIRRADEMKLKNVTFMPLQPFERLAATLAAADIHLVLQKKAAADLVMPSKLTNILAVGGHALVTAEAGTTLHDVVKEHKLGTLVTPEDDKALEKGLSEILAGNREEDAQGARAFSNRYLNKHSIVSGFLRALNF